MKVVCLGAALWTRLSSSFRKPREASGVVFSASHSLSGAAASAFCPSTAQQLSHQLTACYLKTVWKGFEFLITKHTSLLPQEKKKTEEEHL